MQKKKKVPAKSLKLDFTGKMVLLVDLEGYGPMEIRADDKDLVTEVMKLIIEHSGNVSDVNAFPAAELKRLKKYVER